MSSESQALINFYARQGFYRHIQAICNDSLKKRGDDPILIFWKAFGILQEGIFQYFIEMLISLIVKMYREHLGSHS